MTFRRCCGLMTLFWALDARAAEAQCVYSVSPTSFSAESTASSRTLSIITGTQCSWTAASGVDWITVSAGAVGTGIGATTFSIAANPTPSARTGTLTIAGHTISVTQAAGSCGYTVTPTSFSVDWAASSRTLSVIAGTQCAWTATTASAWLEITAGASSSGIGAVSFNVAANTSGSVRTATLTVAGQTITVTQATGPAEPPPTPQNLRFVRD